LHILINPNDRTGILNWKKSSLWKESDYIKLSNIISDASNISISSHTLKRLFGKINYNKHYNPQQATKDALSIFLGYTSWNDYVLQQKKIQHTEVINRKKKLKKSLFFTICLIIISASLFIWNKKILDSNKQPAFSFNVLDSIGSVPFTVTSNYKIEKTNLDNIHIDFDFTHPVYNFCMLYFFLL